MATQSFPAMATAKKSTGTSETGTLEENDHRVASRSSLTDGRAVVFKDLQNT